MKNVRNAESKLPTVMILQPSKDVGVTIEKDLKTYAAFLVIPLKNVLAGTSTIVFLILTLNLSQFTVSIYTCIISVEAVCVLRVIQNHLSVLKNDQNQISFPYSGLLTATVNPWFSAA